MVNFKKLVVSFAVVVSSVLGFANEASADPDPCEALKACQADAAKPDCGDKIKACMEKKDTELQMCTGDLNAAMAADPKCKEAVDKRRQEEGRAAVKAAPLVCDAPGSKGKVGCVCPAGFFPTIVVGKPGHIGCASTQDPAEVAKIKADLEKLGKGKLTATERGELRAYEGLISRLYRIDAKTGEAEMPSYVAAYEAMMKVVSDLYGPTGFIARTERRLADIEQCLATGQCAQYPWITSVANWQEKLRVCMTGGDCSEFPEFDRVRAEARKKVYVRINLGPSLVFRKGGDKAYTLEAGVGLFAPINSDIDWFLKGSIGYGHSSGLDSLGVGRVGMGISYKVTDKFSIEPEGFARFLGRYDSLMAKDGSTLVKGGYGGHAGGLALGLHGRITDVIGIGGYVAGEYQKNEWADCTLTKACYRSDSGFGASVGLNLTFSLGAPTLR